jgi:hypothetical protein
VPNLLMGTVTFHFTDIEGSTKPWENKAPDMSEALARHDRILREDQRAGRLWSVAQAWPETTSTPVGDAERAEQAVRGGGRDRNQSQAWRYRAARRGLRPRHPRIRLDTATSHSGAWMARAILSTRPADRKGCDPGAASFRSRTGNVGGEFAIAKRARYSLKEPSRLVSVSKARDWERRSHGSNWWRA